MKFTLFILGFLSASGISIYYLVSIDREPQGAVVSLIMWMVLGLVTAFFSYLGFSTKSKPKSRALCLLFGFVGGFIFFLGLNLVLLGLNHELSVAAGIVGIIGTTSILFWKPKEVTQL